MGYLPRGRNFKSSPEGTAGKYLAQKAMKIVSVYLFIIHIFIHIFQSFKKKIIEYIQWQFEGREVF